MKNLVFQVNIEAKESRGTNKKRFVYGKELFDYSNKLAEEYAKKIGRFSDSGTLSDFL